MPPRSGQRAGFNFTGPLSGLGNSMLNRFGVKTAEREMGIAPDKPQGQEAAPPGIPLAVRLWLGARLPFAAFTVILGFFTYFYHIAPIVPWLLAFFSLSIAIIVCWPPKAVGKKHRSFWDWGEMYSWMLAVGLAVGLGLLNYGMLETWINTTFLREFSNVKPNTNPMSVMDAGVLTFTKDALLDTTKSAGYKFWFYNYCAAPVVDRHNPEDAPITFWAVGVGCCGSRGDFVCDSAQDQSVRSAVPLRPHNLGPEITEHYHRAIRMSAAANNLNVAKEPVFVLWHKDPHKVGKNSWWLCTVLFIVFTLIALCACCGCQSAFTHISVMQQHTT